MIAFPEFAPSAAHRLKLPDSPRIIVVLDAGGIVRDAHLPAHRKAGFAATVICDANPEGATAFVVECDIPLVFERIPDAGVAAAWDAVFNVALVPDPFAAPLEALPGGSPVLMQKPLGNSLTEARELVELCHRTHLVAAVNRLSRFAPQVAGARAMISSGAIEDLLGLEIRVSMNARGEMFPSVFVLEPLEFTMHSVRYMDLVRSFLGNPTGVRAITVCHPFRELASTRPVIACRFQNRNRFLTWHIVISNKHDHDYGGWLEESFIKWEARRVRFAQSSACCSVIRPATRIDPTMYCATRPRQGSNRPRAPYQGFPMRILARLASYSGMSRDRSASCQRAPSGSLTRLLLLRRCTNQTSMRASPEYGPLIKKGTGQ